MNLKYKWFKIKQKFLRNFTTKDLKPGVIVKWFKGTSVIIKESISFTQTIYSIDDKLNMKPQKSYILNTRYKFNDELDRIFEEDILKIVGYDSDWKKLIPKCPNQEGVEGKCYTFDKFGDRTGSFGCLCSETLDNGLFDKCDPLPGLTKQLEEINNKKV